MSDLRSPIDIERQKAIEAIPEHERTEQQRKALATYIEMTWYSPTALGDR